MGYHHEKNRHARQTDCLCNSPVDTAEYTQGMLLREFRKPPAHIPFNTFLFGLPRSMRTFCRSMGTFLIIPVLSVLHPVHEYAQTALTYVLTHCLPPLTR